MNTTARPREKSAPTSERLLASMIAASLAEEDVAQHRCRHQAQRPDKKGEDREAAEDGHDRSQMRELGLGRPIASPSPR